MKYNSTNIFSDFEFHDAYFKLEKLDGNTLIISVQCANIHKNAKQNPYDTDMEIENAQITFYNLRVKSFEPGVSFKQDSNGNFYTDEPQVIYTGEIAEEKLLNEFCRGTAVFEFGTLENGNYYFDGSGDEPWFQVQFLFDTATIEWDAFRKPAWYEERPFKK